MNTFVFADEAADDEIIVEEAAEDIDVVEEDEEVVEEDSEAVEEEAVEDIEIADDAVVELTNVVELTASSSDNAVSVSADLTLSENIAAVSDNFGTAASEPIKGASTYTFVITYDNAVGYAGLPVAWSGDKKVSKGKATGVDIQVFYAETSKLSGTVSAADAISINAAGTVTASPNSVWTEAKVKKAKIKSAKGATVDITGAGTVVAKKATYIASITLDDKTINKDAKKAFKTALSGIKKEKTKKISANGIAVGDTTDAGFYTVAVYPAYAGNDTEALKVLDSYSKYINVFKASGTLKYKNGIPKKIAGTIGSKKITLKPTKKADKPKGFVNKAETTPTTVANPVGKSYVVTDGSFFGNFYYSAS